jgi:hypothetical protein
MTNDGRQIMKNPETQSDLAGQTYQQTKQLNFTPVPNRYFKMKPNLTQAEALICDCVIRETYGWHKASAEITNSEFVKKTRLSERAIITAKKKLQSQGILCIVNSDRAGRSASIYYIDIFYDETKPPPQTDPYQPVQTEPTTESINTSEQLMEILSSVVQPADVTTESPSLDMQETNAADAEFPVSQNVENPNQKSFPEDRITEKTSVLQYQGTDHGPDINNKTNKAEEIKKKAAFVCKVFDQKFGVDLDYKSAVQLVEKYGVEYCEEKLNIVVNLAKCRKVINPIGLFVSAITSDYQPPKHVREKLAADRRARIAVENSYIKHKQMEKELKEREYLNSLVAQYRQQIEDQEASELRQRAKEELLEQGIKGIFISDFIIDRQINHIIKRDYLKIAC